MADIVDRKTRSRMMSGIKSKNTRPELVLRQALHAQGCRYRLHSRKLHGKPDLILPKYHAVIFVHGCFWHHHKDCRYATIPATRTEFWLKKFEANTVRDTTVNSTLLEAGWRVAIIWECTLRKSENITITVSLLTEWLRSSSATLEIGISESKVNAKNNLFK
ncbi:DNA mismatch repair protein Vsr [Acetobacter tropicalis]|uniref:Very short patch repair endonuclease n=1 Tax=Acetobacter tropicalis TaxID=104102 RepID=A0A149U556_9PROT|nr:very short patch repair endonuclease [Acetobacter tropicalis]KXV60604.1 DNA mismatch repair protein Vsr [Acetobacter tropicalis]